jgi:hypothetical protein
LPGRFDGPLDKIGAGKRARRIVNEYKLRIQSRQGFESISHRILSRLATMDAWQN